ncbi:MAG: MotA/TolQ/ExbB proton channel [uncultured bacterium]|nr:MAG: MotA/TolQ/ExbB proton channel [uncultured bacterium]KKP29826.1 MAG: TolQ protein [candidate division TM6 bacterium GW2011_GWF2_30_66]
MFKFFMGNSVWHLVASSDVISKFILLTLLLLSILCWTVFFYKLILFRIKKKQLDSVIKELNGAGSLEDLIAVAANNKDTLPGYFLSKNFSFLKNIINVDDESGKVSITERDFDMFCQQMEQGIEDILYKEQSYFLVLSTGFAISPLLGLFGTVWGLIHAFISISEKQSADIATVAPGIAEALITTLAGLAVAIPALVMYNYCVSQIKKMDKQFITIADKLTLKIQKHVI